MIQEFDSTLDWGLICTSSSLEDLVLQPLSHLNKSPFSFQMTFNKPAGKGADQIILLQHWPLQEEGNITSIPFSSSFWNLVNYFRYV